MFVSMSAVGDRRRSTRQRLSTGVVTVGCLLVSVLLSPASDAAETSAAPNVLAQYVIMAHSDVLDRTVPLVRTIVAQPATRCPLLTVSDGSPDIVMEPRANPNPSAFGVTVCEAVVEVAHGTQVTVEGSDSPLPVPAKGLLQIDHLVVVGDSGCKGGSKQPCSGTDGVANAWPLPAIARAAADEAPDLVIHVGDYNYRGTPNKTGAGEWSYDGCVPDDGGPLVHQSTYDTWTTWNADFFTAAQPLLAAAPWVMTRGNHELCSRGGSGFFYFLDPHSTLLNPWVKPPGCDAPSVTVEPSHLRFANLDLMLIDTANACGGEDPEGAAGIAYEVDQYMRQLTVVNGLLSKSKNSAWLVGHRPIWSLAKWDAGSPPQSQNQTLQPALAATPSGRLHANAKMILSGHMHQFFSLTFTGDRQPQLVIGNSGVALSGNQLATSWKGSVDGMDAHGLSMASGNAFGYLSAQVVDGGQWQGTVKGFDPSGRPTAQPLATCGLPLHQGSLCRLSQ